MQTTVLDGILFARLLRGGAANLKANITTVNDLFHKNMAAKNLLLPLGISFFTFKAISYLVDVYKKTADLDTNPIHDALYLSFFTQIQSGPLSRYNDTQNTMLSIGGENRYQLICDGIFRFVIGL